MYLFLGILTLLLMGSYAFLDGEVFLGSLNYFMVFVFLCFAFYIRRVDSDYLPSFIMMVVVLLFFLILFARGASRQQTFVWCYTYPLFSLFLLGWKAGLLMTLLLLGLSFMVTLLKEYIPFYTPYPKGFHLRFSASYLMVFSLVFVFEHTRVKTREKLDTVMNELNNLAVRDGLTNLYNRRYMDEIMSIVLRQRNSTKNLLAFLMIDIDNFKFYNDS